MSELPAQAVHRGLWTNLERGPVMGSTITTDTQTGNLIVALLAILTTLGAHRLWNLVTFAYHQVRANGKPADGFFRQQQALLRSLPAPAALLTDWIKLWWVWRKADRAFLRSSIQVIFGVTFTVGTLLAGTFTSLAVSTPDIQVLVQSRQCAPWSPDRINNASGSVKAAYGQYIGATRKSSIDYATECYRDYSVVPERCKMFTRPSIPFSQARVDCPFATTLCKNVSKPAIQLDSGLVDLNDGLGLNLAPSERVRLRKRTTCAVLEIENRTSVVNVSSLTFRTRDPLPNEKALVLHLGRSFVPGNENFTFSMSLLLSNLSSDYSSVTASNYQTEALKTSGTFTPPPEMQGLDADIFNIHVGKNNVLYRQPTNDPLFAAHRPLKTGDSRPEQQNVTYYRSDFVFGVLGCGLQYQFCHAQANGAPDFCSNLTGLPNWVEDFSLEQYPNASNIQRAILQDLGHAMLNTDIQIASYDLKARKLIENAGFINSLPDDQWVREVVGWESTLWASLQIEMAEYAIGRAVRVPGAAALMKTDLTDGEQALCGKQRMKNPGGFVNINVFAVSFIGAFSLVVTLLDLVLLRLIIVPKRSPRIDRWIQDGIFQLQRRAYEAHGEGVWSRLEKDVPMTTSIGEKLAELPVESQPLCTCIVGVKEVQQQDM
ncbi:uncharacterized protein K460DRAFT_132067 [Cucurbitaria berberidis CBS 394.84]|uniref:Uncharacterized protein n=1 Tax=Cucurbitaria berberidis CBS 394.84 TaxID=1168544 RepID=A0A9P4L9X9_9PLEO|nr:uncharacterized protein K460DRAFT_132067 [Cucurbitaria berberidis CBS 394.84]KAF1846848.1 hypothetical protein K460DRAFT_132067 [Cucurbitaria berberidis CBS 394.84]